VAVTQLDAVGKAWIMFSMRRLYGVFLQFKRPDNFLVGLGGIDRDWGLFLRKYERGFLGKRIAKVD